MNFRDAIKQIVQVEGKIFLIDKVNKQISSIFVEDYIKLDNFDNYEVRLTLEEAERVLDKIRGN